MKKDTVVGAKDIRYLCVILNTHHEDRKWPSIELLFLIFPLLDKRSIGKHKTSFTKSDKQIIFTGTDKVHSSITPT